MPYSAGRMLASESLILLEILPEEFIQAYLYTAFSRIIAVPRLIAPSNNNRPRPLTPRTLTLKINQGTKFGTLCMRMFSLCDVIIFLFNGTK